MYSERINPDLIRYIESVLSNVLRDYRLRRDMEDEIYRCFRNDTEDIVTHLQTRYGDSLASDQLYREMQGYVERRCRDIEDNARPGRGYSRSGVERSSMSYQRSGSDIGRMMNDSLSRGSIDLTFNRQQQQPFHRVESNPIPTPMVKREEPVVDTWKFGKVLSDMSNSLVAIEALDTIWSDKSIDHKNIELTRGVNSPRCAIAQIKPYIKDTTSPFLMSIGCCRMVHVDVPPETILDLRVAFQNNAIYDKIDPSDPIYTERHAKAILSTLDEFTKRITHTAAISLEKFFVGRLRSMIRSAFHNPKQLGSVQIPTDLGDMSEFFRGGAVYDTLREYPKYGPLRDLIIRTAIPYSIRPENMCTWEDPFDRISMLTHPTIEPITVEGRHIMEIITSDSPEWDVLVDERVKTFTVLKVPMQIIYSNIYPSDLRYKMDCDDFAVYTFPVDKPSNVIEAVAADKIHGIERYIHLEVQPYGTITGTYGGVVDGTVGIAPIIID